MRAVRFDKTGGPEVLSVAEVSSPSPGAGEVLIRHEAIGVNFIDTYFRSGLYPTTLPSGLGSEGAGIVEAVGEGVSRFKTGNRVAYVGSGLGSYADYRVIPADRAVAVPDGVDARTAAAVLLKGMTAEFLLRRCYPVKTEDVVLIHAAAGGVGQLLVQWSKLLGAEVIATAGSPEKLARAKALGADHLIQYGEGSDVAAEVKRITDGKGVAVAYDSVGKSTFEATLDSLAKRGVFVSFGNASGPAPPVDPRALSTRGSLFFTRPTLFDYIVTTEELDQSAVQVFDLVAAGKLEVEIGQTFALTEARQAHEALESRATVGASLLLP